jgi:hypothetical protein
LKVPEAGVPVEPIKAAAASSKVQLIPTASVPPITSETRMNFCPAGATRSMSTSDGKVWLNPVTLTVTLLIPPDNPETVMLLGYGLATPASLIVMGAAFANVTFVVHGVPDGVAVAVAVGEGVGGTVAVAVGEGVGGTVAVGLAVAVGLGVGVAPPQLPLTLNTMCMLGKPMAAVVVGTVIPHAAALR